MGILIIVAVLLFIFFAKGFKERRKQIELERKLKLIGINDIIFSFQENHYPYFHRTNRKFKYNSTTNIYITSKKGLSELFFEGYVEEYFGKIYKKNVRVGQYTPDYALIDESNNFALDVEIDEPYSIDDRVLLHLKNQNSRRDIYFLESGWNVLRFSEEQVLTQPDSCIKLISLVHARTTLTSEYLKYCTDADELVSKIRWDEKIAARMRREKFRESLYPELKLYRKIDDEFNLSELLICGYDDDFIFNEYYKNFAQKVFLKLFEDKYHHNKLVHIDKCLVRFRNFMITEKLLIVPEFFVNLVRVLENQAFFLDKQVNTWKLLFCIPPKSIDGYVNDKLENVNIVFNKPYDLNDYHVRERVFSIIEKNEIFENFNTSTISYHYYKLEAPPF